MALGCCVSAAHRTRIRHPVRKVGTALALAVLLSVVVATPVGADPSDVPEGDVSWLSTGDSYSSGEGVFGNDGACAQTRAAYGPSAVDMLRGQYGWTIGPEGFTACTGHLVEQCLDDKLG